MGKKKNKIKKLKDLTMARDRYITPHDYYQNNLDRLLEENRKLKESLRKFAGYKSLEEENTNLRKENTKLREHLKEQQSEFEQSEALLKLNIEYKEYIIEQRLRINELKEQLKSLNEKYNTVLYRD
jgi:exonuclease VII large subunit